MDIFQEKLKNKTKVKTLPYSKKTHVLTGHFLFKSLLLINYEHLYGYQNFATQKLINIIYEKLANSHEIKKRFYRILIHFPSCRG